MDNGLIGELRGWLSHPLYSSGNLADWGAGLVLILILSFLWSTVLKGLAE